MNEVIVIAGWMLVAAGMILGAWALFYDRSRGRRRCPRCWYDMAGVPSLRCPECGREAKRERRLFRTRRRWRLALLGCVVALAGSAHFAYLAVKRDGWWRFVPTTVIIWCLPEAGSKRDAAVRVGAQDPWVEEMKRRIAANALRDWQWRWALERTRVIRTRPKWHEGEPVRVAVHPPSWLPSEISAMPQIDGGYPVRRYTGLTVDMGFPKHAERRQYERDQLIGLVPAEMRAVELDVTVSVQNSEADQINAIFGLATDMFIENPYSWRGRIRIPVEIVPEDEPVLLPATGDDLDRAAARAIGLHLRTTPAAGARLSATINRIRAPELDGIALGFLVEVEYEGDLVEVVHVDNVSHHRSGPFTDRSTQVHILSGLSMDELCSGRWMLRVRGDPTESLGELDHAEYWAGEFEVQLKDILEWPQ